MKAARCSGWSWGRWRWCVGLAAAAGLTRFMSALLFEVSAVDPVTYAAVSALLIAAAVLASYFPARRAMAIDPVEALRSE